MGIIEKILEGINRIEEKLGTGQEGKKSDVNMWKVEFWEIDTFEDNQKLTYIFDCNRNTNSLNEILEFTPIRIGWKSTGQELPFQKTSTGFVAPLGQGKKYEIRITDI